VKEYRFRQRDPVLLQAVSDQDLCDCFPMTLANLVERRIVRFHISDQRAVGFDDDAVLVAEVDDLSLLAERMELDLIDMRRVDLRKTLDLFNLPNAPVANTNTAGLTIFQQLLQSLIDFLPRLRAITRSMYQE